MDFKTKYIDETNCRIVQGKYSNGNIALQVVAEVGYPVCRATVNLGQYGLTPEPGNVFIYGDYSEHEGVHTALQAAGIVGPIINTIPVGGHGATAIECKLLIDNEMEVQ